jgi:hypothetical protein
MMQDSNKKASINQMKKFTTPFVESVVRLKGMLVCLLQQF